MHHWLSTLAEKVLSGYQISLNEALELYEIEKDILFQTANHIREKACGKKVSLCSILNAKSGKCEENCAYCAQSGHYFTGIKEYPLIESEQALFSALEHEKANIHRFSLVTSGYALSGQDFEKILTIYSLLREKTSLALCASLGCLSYEELKALKKAGVSMYHHNIETSPQFFPRICSTHTFEERIKTIEAAKKAGLEVCSGGILGMGESREDRIEMAFVLRSLGITSIPINILVPIKGTPLENTPLLSEEEIYRTMAIYRFIFPKAHLRIAGGSLRLEKGKVYHLGINAALVGNLLTTVGTSIEEEKSLILKAGLEITP
ncbi:MAG: biotin synthase BioB [Brevinematales bacterium]|nr:biotin synthase BioB [Brevinematales bacterium]